MANVVSKKKDEYIAKAGQIFHLVTTVDVPFHANPEPCLLVSIACLHAQLERLKEKKEALESEYGRRVAYEDGSISVVTPPSSHVSGLISVTLYNH